MSYYNCRKCGESASSKCVNQRSVFPGDKMAALLTWVLKSSAERNESGTYTVTLKLPHISCEGEENEEKAILEALMLIREIAEDAIRHYACDHDWQIEAGQECLMGCCC